MIFFVKFLKVYDFEIRCISRRINLKNINSKMGACKGKNTIRSMILQGMVQDVGAEGMAQGAESLERRAQNKEASSSSRAKCKGYLAKGREGEAGILSI